MRPMTTKQRAEAGLALAKRVLEYFTDEPIEPFLECDIEVRAMAQAVLSGIEFKPEKTASADHRERERSLAFDQAAGTIDACTGIERDGHEQWQDTSDIAEAPGAIEAVRVSVLYLDTRGLIERHPDHPEWVRVRGAA